ncbi:MAG: hypothetical protein ACT4UP_11340 [Gammaproteobacteria bacterium]
MVELHIVAGLLSLLAGGVALFSLKGSPLHRKSGIVFVVAMLALTASAAIIARFMIPNRVNVVAALATAYLVSTSLLTVRYRVAEMRWLIAAFAVLALVVGLRALSLGIEALGRPDGLVDQVPATPLFLFAAVGIGGALLDMRMLRAGAIEGAPRLVRHLWRMGFALWTATTSFFLGQAKVFPDAVRKPYLLMIPVLVVALTLIYWLARVTIRKARAV